MTFMNWLHCQLTLVIIPSAPERIGFTRFRILDFRLHNPQIVPHAHRAKAYVKIAETDPKQTEPRPEHMALIQTGDTAICLVTGRCAGKLIAKSADQVSERMTTKGVAAEKNEVDRE